jgi:hypothetical protein
MVKNSVHDTGEGGRGIDTDRVRGKALARRVLPARKGLSLLGRSSPLGRGAGGEPPVQRFPVDLKHKHRIKQVDKAAGISGTAAKERRRVAAIGRQRADLRHVPQPRPRRVRTRRQGLPRMGIAPIRQLPIAVDSVAAAPLQLVADRRLPGAGDAVD